MKKFVFPILIIFTLALAANVALAKSTKAAGFTLPENAREVAPGVFDLGVAQDTNGRDVRGYAFLRYKNGFDHKPRHNGNRGGGGSGTSSCYAYLARGTKWKSLEEYMVDPTNTVGFDSGYVKSVVTEAVNKWEAAAENTGIFDGEIPWTGDGVDVTAPDDKNEVLFGSIDSPGAIAVTVVWGYFNGPPRARELVAWDMLFDQDDFDWSSTGEVGKMDFDNITSHEMGHAFGMGHPENTCTEETMFRFASPGETIKRTLNLGDITGILKLYK